MTLDQQLTCSRMPEVQSSPLYGHLVVTDSVFLSRLGTAHAFSLNSTRFYRQPLMRTTEAFLAQWTDSHKKSDLCALANTLLSTLCCNLPSVTEHVDVPRAPVNRIICRRQFQTIFRHQTMEMFNLKMLNKCPSLLLSHFILIKSVFLTF